LTSPRARGRRIVPGPIRLLVADWGLVLIASEDARRDGLAALCHFHQCVGRLVEPSWDVIKLETVVLVLQLTDLLEYATIFGLRQFDSFMTWSTTSCELPQTSSHQMPSSMAMRSPLMSASYSATLFEAGK
jgi:hypothetical protein